METYVVRVYRKNSDQLAGMVEAIDTNQHVPFQGVSGLQIVLEQSIGAFESDPLFRNRSNLHHLSNRSCMQ